jgi:hypothetical protein
MLKIVFHDLCGNKSFNLYKFFTLFVVHHCCWNLKFICFSKDYFRTVLRVRTDGTILGYRLFDIRYSPTKNKIILQYTYFDEREKTNIKCRSISKSNSFVIVFRSHVICMRLRFRVKINRGSGSVSFTVFCRRSKLKKTNMSYELLHF